MKTLTIISHTGHYKRSNGQIVGLGSTVTEINHLLGVFDSICHIAMLHDIEAPANALPYVSEKIVFVPIPAVGGKRLIDKFSIIRHAPVIIATVSKLIKQSDYFQFRAPTGIGVFVMPYLILLNKTRGWFKYAGNWKQQNAPWGYRVQKWLLQKQSRMVTINGQWEDQPKQCLSFENPCLSNHEYEQGKIVRRGKYENVGLLNFCFVGRLEPEKGIELLIEAFKELTAIEKKSIGTIHIVGDGARIDQYRSFARDDALDFKFHGLISRRAVQEVYKISHAILLPSVSEGFPKVITEAMNYGCIPVVSNVSAIGQYIHDGQNGLLISSIDVSGLLNNIRDLLNKKKNDRKLMIADYDEMLKRFTYAHYNERIEREIINLNASFNI